MGDGMREDGSTAERWRPVVGWEGLYEVSDHGRVRSVDRVVMTRSGPRSYQEKVLQPATDRKGYKQVGLRSPGQRADRKVHRLVLEAFVGPCPPGCEARHLNGAPGDNRRSNLAWGTPGEQWADKVAHGTATVGVRACGAKLNPALVRQLRAEYASGGVSQQQLADRVGVSQNTIGCMLLRKTWTHVR
jgi:hypothetical protein